MTTDRPRRIALVGALLGTFASAYLLVDYVFGSGICLTGSGCDVVRASPLAYPLGIPMPLLGLGFYLAAVTLLLIPTSRVAGMSARQLAAGWGLIGLAVMAFLTVVELFAIQAVCSWCLLSAFGAALLAGGTLAAWRRGDPTAVPTEARSSRARRRMSEEADHSRRDLRRFAVVTGGMLSVAMAALLAMPAITGGAPVDTAIVGRTDRPWLGSGPVEVVVYSDFQCPACAVVAPILSRLADEGGIALGYRYFPLVSIHSNATAAAEAAHAAALQGGFWAFHDALFKRQAAWSTLPAAAQEAFEAIAAEIGLDLQRWRADAGSSAVVDIVAADRREAEELRLSGTPTIFIDGTRYGGRLTYEEISDALHAGRAGG